MNSGSYETFRDEKLKLDQFQLETVKYESMTLQQWDLIHTLHRTLCGQGLRTNESLEYSSEVVEWVRFPAAGLFQIKTEPVVFKRAEKMPDTGTSHWDLTHLMALSGQRGFTVLQEPTKPVQQR